jgi:hypothetical protein
MSQLDVKNAFLNSELRDIQLSGVVTGAGFLSLVTHRYLSTLLLVVGLFFLYILMT